MNCLGAIFFLTTISTVPERLNQFAQILKYIDAIMLTVLIYEDTGCLRLSPPYGLLCSLSGVTALRVRWQESTRLEYHEYLAAATLLMSPRGPEAAWEQRAGIHITHSRRVRKGWHKKVKLYEGTQCKCANDWGDKYKQYECNPAAAWSLYFTTKSLLSAGNCRITFSI